MKDCVIVENRVWQTRLELEDYGSLNIYYLSRQQKFFLTDLQKTAIISDLIETFPLYKGQGVS